MSSMFASQLSLGETKTTSHRLWVLRNLIAFDSDSDAQGGAAYHEAHARRALTHDLCCLHPRFEIKVEWNGTFQVVGICASQMPRQGEKRQKVVHPSGIHRS